MKKVVLIALLFSLYGSAAIAQSDDGKAKSGSVYSKMGIGYPVGFANTASQSMGVLGVSYNEILVGGLSNPAHWGSTVYGLGSGGLGLQSFNASSGAQNAKNTRFSVNRFQLQLPAIRGELGVSASFSPVTEASYRTYSESTRFIGEGVQQDTVTLGLENRGGGGANRAELGIGWKINSNISVGYAASVVFLSMDDSYVATFPQSIYRSSNYTLETSGVGFGNRFGTTVRLPNFLKEDDQLGLGASVSLPVSLDAERRQSGTISNGAITVIDESSSRSGTITYPMKVSGGVSYRPNNLLLLATEGFYQGWSNYENDVNASGEDIFVDRYKWGLGVQYFPYLTGSNNFLSSFKYRLGASYDTGHLRLEGERINTLKFSLGLGIMSPRSRSSIDLSLEYGIRGTNSMDLVKEQIWGVRLSLNLAEFMFSRPKLQ